MTQYSRLCIGAVLLSCLACTAWGASAPDVAQQQHAVSSAMQHQAAPDGAASLLQWSTGGAGAEAALTVYVSALPVCNTFSLNDGRRIVIDLRNTLNLHDGASVPVGDTLVRLARTSLFSKDPEAVSRIVLDLDRPCDFALDRQEGRIVLYLAERAADHLDRLGSNLEKMASSVVVLTAAPVPAAPQPATAAPASRLLPAEDRIAALAEQIAQLAEMPEASAPASATHEMANDDAPHAQAAPSRVTRLVEELSEVAAARVDVSIDSFRDAAQAVEESAEAPAEQPAAPEEAAPAEPAEPAEPEPPGPRIERTPVDAEAHRSFTNVLRSLSAGSAAAAEDATAMAAFETFDAATAAAADGAAAPAAPKSTYQGDPLYQPVDLDFRDTGLSHVVAVLANMAGINVMGGSDLSTPVSITLHQVPLKQAMETTLSLNNLGLINRSGIYYIVPYEEAMQAQRRTRMIDLENAEATEVQAVMEAILKGDQDQAYVDIASHEAANRLVIAAPESRIDELLELAHQLDVTEMLPPVVTETIPVNWADPQELTAIVQGALTKSEGLPPGTVAADPRGRSLVVTDQPVVVEQIRQLVATLDTPAKLVHIDAMIVDVLLGDAAETGVDWLISAVRSQSRRDAATGTGRMVGNLQQLDLGTDLNIGDKAGTLAFNVLSADIDWSGIVQAEVRNDDSKLVSRPQLTVQENKPATITISQEIPYVELTQTDAGGSQTSIEFKDIGTDLTVTPRVTHDNHIMVDLEVKESDTGAVFNGVPIENKRFITTSSMVRSGHTLLVGGLRKNNNDASIRKVPVLGDVPVLNFLFRNNVRTEAVNELLVFLTCHVLEDSPVLSDYETDKYEFGMNQETRPDASNTVLQDLVRPNKARPPIWRANDDAEDTDEMGEDDSED